MWPSAFGAHNYQLMSYNSETGLVYLPHIEMGMAIGTVSLEEKKSILENLKYIKQTNLFGELSIGTDSPW